MFPLPARYLVNRLRRAGMQREAAMRLVNHSSELIHQVYQREKVEDLAQWRNAVQFLCRRLDFPDFSQCTEVPCCLTGKCYPVNEFGGESSPWLGNVAVQAEFGQSSSFALPVRQKSGVSRAKSNFLCPPTPGKLASDESFVSDFLCADWQIRVIFDVVA